ncbi:25S rRNA (uracil2634-N3)-methyltransferase [Aspergillus clavatus NRRL 1]|uniref:25S rRNA (uridine-N(3))-methyltransferase BMT5-like domain-containing protein n=1 Tax=Aspergillus clavatus (strain ATCC 1007 / CBS 513.65 / DSM 816 / NCTC 3887 / NRRL 1 / QM 1276 / 107) TaxID=344612 RepID=A1C9R3_ASPCL|nr:uncharacterized protein ACLA_009010 [Aspergillus clavatus NRRL 1]EAW12481.1 conserved hypothetical protein [Aspergillus clavatus NRRL 1]
MHMFSRLSTSTGASSTSHGQKGGNGNKGPTGKKGPVQHRRPIVPFGKRDRILLVGEGDFSFARSLAVQYRCRDILATCYDSKETLWDKYPQVEKNIEDILGAFSKKGKQNDENDQEEEEDESKAEEEQQQQAVPEKKDDHRRGPNVFFGVDARKLGSPAGGGKDVRTGYTRRERSRPAWQEAKRGPSSGARPGGPWDVICFNFPHVGGLSTDVNRQVRSNQELLVAFFKACVPLLSARPEVISDDEDEDENGDWDLSEDSEAESSNQVERETLGNPDGKRYRTEPGQILVTTFEGEPYTLWNIKDLARHAGLRVVTSFKFPWTSYQGYSHARTLGEIEGKHGGRGGWRGEDREARMYVFEVKEDEHGSSRKHAPNPKIDPKGKNKKRSRNVSDTEDSD